MPSSGNMANHESINLSEVNPVDFFKPGEARIKLTRLPGLEGANYAAMYDRAVGYGQRGDEDVAFLTGRAKRWGLNEVIHETVVEIVAQMPPEARQNNALVAKTLMSQCGIVEEAVKQTLKKRVEQGDVIESDAQELMGYGGVQVAREAARLNAEAALSENGKWAAVVRPDEGVGEPRVDLERVRATAAERDKVAAGVETKKETGTAMDYFNGAESLRAKFAPDAPQDGYAERLDRKVVDIQAGKGVSKETTDNLNEMSRKAVEEAGLGKLVVEGLTAALLSLPPEKRKSAIDVMGAVVGVVDEVAKREKAILGAKGNMDELAGWAPIQVMRITVDRFVRGENGDEKILRATEMKSGPDVDKMADELNKAERTKKPAEAASAQGSGEPKDVWGRLEEVLKNPSVIAAVTAAFAIIQKEVDEITDLKKAEALHRMKMEEEGRPAPAPEPAARPEPEATRPARQDPSRETGREESERMGRALELLAEEIRRSREERERTAQEEREERQRMRDRVRELEEEVKKAGGRESMRTKLLDMAKADVAEGGGCVRCNAPRGAGARCPSCGAESILGPLFDEFPPLRREFAGDGGTAAGGQRAGGERVAAGQPQAAAAEAGAPVARPEAVGGEDRSFFDARDIAAMGMPEGFRSASILAGGDYDWATELNRYAWTGRGRDLAVQEGVNGLGKETAVALDGGVIPFLKAMRGRELNQVEVKVYGGDGSPNFTGSRFVDANTGRPVDYRMVAGFFNTNEGARRAFERYWGEFKNPRPGLSDPRQVAAEIGCSYGAAKVALEFARYSGFDKGTDQYESLLKKYPKLKGILGNALDKMGNPPLSRLMDNGQTEEFFQALSEYQGMGNEFLMAWGKVRNVREMMDRMDKLFEKMGQVEGLPPIVPRAEAEKDVLKKLVEMRSRSQIGDEDEKVMLAQFGYRRQNNDLIYEGKGWGEKIVMGFRNAISTKGSQIPDRRN